jgi:hypothetical protein
MWLNACIPSTNVFQVRRQSCPKRRLTYSCDIPQQMTTTMRSQPVLS